MEQPENKIIADKINSLNGLPEGYQPNLDAKWALLQNEGKKKGVIFFMNGTALSRVAAVILLLILSSFLFWNFSKTQNIVETKPALHQSPAINSDQNFVEVKKPEPEHNSIQRSHKSKNEVSPILHSDPPEKTEVAKVEMNYNATDTTQPLANILQPAEIPKTKKARYMQIDIDDHLKENENSFYAQGVKIKFGINFNHKAGESSNHESTPLKISSNF